MKPKEWLLKNGHIKEAGRGRMSAAHKALIAEALAADPTLVIEGYSVSKPAPNTGKPATVTREPVTSTGVADVPEQRRHPDEWEPFDDAGNRIPTGIKGICDNCKSSFTYCYCRHSVSILDGGRVSVVTFKPKKGGK